jgi:DNA polymerase (family X)
MKNREIARMFYEISEFLEMDSVPFKPRAYQNAALTLETLKDDIGKIYRDGGLKALKEIPSIGENIAKKIEEYLTTGTLRYYEEFKKKMPIDLEEIVRVEGVGPKKAKVLYEKLGVTNLKELEEAARSGKIAPLAGFGEKTQKNVIEAVEFLKRSRGRFLLGEIQPVAHEVIGRLKTLKEVGTIEVAGSLRRMKETIDDVDILVTSGNPSRVMDFFTSLPGVVKILGKGSTKSSVRMKEGFDMDLRVIPPGSYGAALQYFTGSRDHNIALRKIAIDRGLKLSEYGLFKGSKAIAAKTEEDVYRALGMRWIPPEIREDRGEIEAARDGRLPELISPQDIRGDLHVHSNWDGGADSIEDIAQAALNMGYDYVGIADHTQFLKIERGLDENRIRERNREIDRLNEKLKRSGRRFRILNGCEANILNDGSVDLEDEVLAELDFVLAGIHSQFKMTRAAMTERICRAMENPHVDILSHPTGRILKRRDAFDIDFDKILKAAKETGTALEINAYFERLDLNDANILRAKKAGITMCVNTDAHRADQLHQIAFGVAQARRGWAEKKDIINTRPVDKMLASLSSSP